MKYDLEGYFHEVVIGGPGAFTVVAESSDGFSARTVVSKLVLEIASRPTAPGDLAAQEIGFRPGGNDVIRNAVPPCCPEFNSKATNTNFRGKRPWP